MRVQLHVIVLALFVAAFSFACAPGAPMGPGLTQDGNPTTSMAGGDKSDADGEYQDAVISSQSLALTVPQNQNSQSAKIAYFYRLTYKVSADVNNGIRKHLNMIEDIVDHRPTLRYQNKRVWGPWTPALSPATWLFAVEKVGPGRYIYLLQGKRKGAPNSAYVKVFAGVIQRGLLPRRGAGTFVIDFEVARKLDPINTKQQGAVHVAYDTRGGQAKIGVNFKGIKDSTGKPTDAAYHYALSAQGNGEFKFLFKDDVHHKATQLSTQELLAIHSRWNRGGEGRADAVVTGGDLGKTKVHYQECWNDRFQRTYYLDSHKINPPEGSAANCTVK